MSWCDGRLVAFDVETTGTDPEEARIVTAAVAKVGGGQETETLTWLCDPGVPIPDEATEVHGITTEKAQADGLPAAEVVPAVVEALAARPDGAPIVIFNARYDLTVLDRECRRHGIEPLQDRGPLYVVDPLVIDKHLHRYRKGSRKLDAQAAHYGATLDEAHEAAADAIAAARVAWCIGRRGEVIRRVWNPEMGREKAALLRDWERVRHDLPALHAAQLRWAHEQAEGLAEHFREQGNPDWENVRTEWPLVPLSAAVA